MMLEVKNCPGYYVNEEGNVFSCIKKNFKGIEKGCDTYIDKSNPIKLTPSINKRNGYVYISLGKYGKKRLHRVVAERFIPNPFNLPEVNHKDEDKTNNRWSNLEWVNRQNNAEYSLAKHYIVEHIATGKQYQVFNLSSFCRENGLHVGSMHDTLKQRQNRQQHKGWKIIKKEGN